MRACAEKGELVDLLVATVATATAAAQRELDAAAAAKTMTPHVVDLLADCRSVSACACAS
jgi:hypothetical protein